MTHMIHPLGKRVLVKRDEPTEQGGSIILVSRNDDTPLFGTVVEISEELTVAPYDVGDLVILKRHAGQEVKLNGSTFILIDDDDLLGRVEIVEEAVPEVVESASQLPA